MYELSAEESKSQTWAYETTTDRLAVGPFSPKPDHQNQVYTAHQRIVHKAGFDASVSVGGSIKEDGTVAYRVTMRMLHVEIGWLPACAWPVV